MKCYIFDTTQKTEYLECLREYGFCVIKDIIDKETCKSRIDEIWQHPALLGTGIIDRNDPSTWTKESGWYTDDKGFLDINGGFSETELEYYWKIRFNKDLVEVYKTIYNEDVLLLMDRTGIMRPTKNVLINNEKTDKPEWRTAKSWLHLDSNPWEPSEKIKLQGLVTLTDQTETSGGFCCIPGFNKRINNWAKDNKNTHTGGIFYFSKNSDEQNKIKNIIAPAGSLIVWDNKLAHCNFPNTGEHFRIVDYVTYNRKSLIDDDLIKNLKKIGLDSKLLHPSSKFFEIMTHDNKLLVDFDSYNNLISTSTEIDGYRLFKQGSELECKGRLDEAIKNYKKAFKMCPLLEEI